MPRISNEVLESINKRAHKERMLLYRLVEEFGPVEDDYGHSICGYCSSDIDNTWVVHDHDEECAWRAAKQYLAEGES